MILTAYGRDVFHIADGMAGAFGNKLICLNCFIFLVFFVLGVSLLSICVKTLRGDVNVHSDECKRSGVFVNEML